MLNRELWPKVRLWVYAVVGVVLVGALLWWSGPWMAQVFADPQRLRTWLVSWGVWSPAVYIALQIIQVVVFVLPGEVVQIAGGWVFGFWAGSLWSVVGIAMGSSIAFGAARLLGVGFVHRIAGPQAVARFDGLMSAPQFVGTLFLLFLIPGIPKDILCYVAGLSSVRFLPFLLLSSLARLPGIFGSSLMGKALYQENWTILVVTAVAALALFVVGWWHRDTIFRWITKWTTPSKEESK